MKVNPGVKVSLGTAENVNGPYKTMLEQTVNASNADIVTASLPLVVLFAGTQRQLVRAAIAGSVKG